MQTSSGFDILASTCATYVWYADLLDRTRPCDSGLFLIKGIQLIAMMIGFWFGFRPCVRILLPIVRVSAKISQDLIRFFRTWMVDRPHQMGPPAQKKTPDANLFGQELCDADCLPMRKLSLRMCLLGPSAEQIWLFHHISFTSLFRHIYLLAFHHYTLYAAVAAISNHDIACIAHMSLAMC